MTDAPSSRSHVYHHLTEGGGLHHREVQVDEAGGLLIIGHDLGETEYEFERRVSPDGVRRLLASTGADPTTPVLDALRGAFASTLEIERRLEELQVDSEFWNRIG